MSRDAEVPGMHAGHLSPKKIQREVHERVDAVLDAERQLPRSLFYYVSTARPESRMRCVIWPIEHAKLLLAATPLMKHRSQ